MVQKTLYEAPILKVVAFKIENGYGSIVESASDTETITFGGTLETGLMSHSSDDHSGLGQYGYNSDLFGSGN